MPTPQKEAIVKEITEKFSSARSIFLADFTGVNGNTITELRKGFRESKIEYRVVKNTLAKLSFDNAGIQGMEQYLEGVNSYLISYDDPAMPIKVVEKYKKELEGKFALKAAFFEGQIVKTEQMAALAKLPGKQELRAQILGMLQAPLSKLVGVVKAPMRNVVGVLKAYEAKSEK
ncbi:MAG: 50S ribosomal protein L10 [Calditrichaceae bacterium]|nr:50S ribosomal protein L10 [Calditrichia bacterium]NUQ40471.1 50S ribosomal protein L10 [Calditrichaceae bacterium]